jgi:hypothetical protein
MAVGFWDLFFDSEYRQRADINELRELESNIVYDVASLGTYTSQLRRQVHDLSMTVAVLVKMLEEVGQIDAKALRDRVEAEVQAMAAAAKAAHAGEPDNLNQMLQAGSAAKPAPAKPPTTLVTCVQCGATVPANQTTITARGTICDRCEAGQ